MGFLPAKRTCDPNDLFSWPLGLFGDFATSGPRAWKPVADVTETNDAFHIEFERAVCNRGSRRVGLFFALHLRDTGHGNKKRRPQRFAGQLAGFLFVDVKYLLKALADRLAEAFELLPEVSDVAGPADPPRRRLLAAA